MSMAKKWNSVIKFEELLRIGEYDDFEKIVNNGISLVALYAYYHYYNADDTKIDELLSGIVIEECPNMHISGIYQSLLDENSVDFISLMEEDYFRGVFLTDYEEQLTLLATKMAYVVVKTPYMENGSAISIYMDLNKQLTEDNIYMNRILCDFELPIEEKVKIQNLVSAFRVKGKNIQFEILFSDDIQEEIDDIENPKEYVSYGELKLLDKKSICYFGEENSFITLISAMSLKKMFYDYGNRGLLDSNLRFFVSSKKIDPLIVNSIQNESQNFCYYNNGIIITCDDYAIRDNVIQLHNFSIVNGGQTTNLIGRTEFNDDFPLICKLIKNKYDTVEEKVEFLSNVAKASNTQKPINAKDLIANRKEQRLLKLQFENCGIFLRVKRGEKIDKSVYKKNWQNASNDEIAQLLYAMVYQCPGAAKNSKSRLLETELIYNTIFASTYMNGFFIALQHLKIAYSEWLKRLKKTESKTSVKFGLAKSALLMCLATYGLLYKATINDELKTYLLTEKDITNTNAMLKAYIQQNDIGQTNIFKKDAIRDDKWNQYFAVFDQLFGYILIPGYQSYKRAFPTYAYSQFTKSDSYYYRYVVPKLVECLKDDTICNDILIGTERHKIYVDIEKTLKEKEREYRPGLEQELIDYRRKIYHESNKQIQAYEVITNNQLASVTKYMPRTTNDLLKFCRMRPEQISKYGENILRIISKYASIDSMV